MIISSPHYFRNIFEAQERVLKNLSMSELKELLNEDQSYLCAEYRPEFSERLSKVFNNLDEDSRSEILDALDDMWITILWQMLKNNKEASDDQKS